MQAQKNELMSMFHLKQEGEQSDTRHVMFCLCQRTVGLLDVDYMQLETHNTQSYSTVKIVAFETST